MSTTTELLAANERYERLRREYRDLTRRLGFGDNITEPQADNDTIVAWFEEQSRDANEWQESQLWRNDCYVAGHPDDEDCHECDPTLRRAAAEQRYERLWAAAISLAYRRAADCDAEFGCCHSEEDFRAGGRLPEWDGDEFEPIPEHCTGAKMLAHDLALLEVANSHAAMAHKPLPMGEAK